MLGRLGYKPDEVDRCRLPDIIDALIAYDETETRRFRREATLVRQATLILWNTQVVEESRITDPLQLWTFGWEKEPDREEQEDRDTETDIINLQERQKNYLKNM